MPLSPDLWDSLTPPDVWVHVQSLDHDSDDYLSVVLRVKEPGRRSISASCHVSRYAPTDSIVLAVSKCLAAMAVAQKRLTAAEMKAQLTAACRNHVDPF
jgi:hypothetical protein